jgi:hypothetical protein
LHHHTTNQFITRTKTNSFNLDYIRPSSKAQQPSIVGKTTVSSWILKTTEVAAKNTRVSALKRIGFLVKNYLHSGREPDLTTRSKRSSQKNANRSPWGGKPGWIPGRYSHSTQTVSYSGAWQRFQGIALHISPVLSLDETVPGPHFHGLNPHLVLTQSVELAMSQEA